MAAFFFLFFLFFIFFLKNENFEFCTDICSLGENLKKGKKCRGGSRTPQHLKRSSL